MSSADFIRLRGVRQNNLRGWDMDLPLGRLIVVTGLSGAGKSSLVFDTLHAEGQRRYVETFSPYARQFLERFDRPRVDALENIRPSIAIGQGHTIKTSRSTVGTMTELCDYFKVWFSHTARLFDPATDQPVEDDNPLTIWRKATANFPDQSVLLVFRLRRPATIGWPEILDNLRRQGFSRLLLDDRLVSLAEIDAARLADRSELRVVQDRLILQASERDRFLDSATACLHFGQGELLLCDPAGQLLGHYSQGLHSPATGRTFHPPVPGLFSFNSPLGACPQCRGFGRIIEIDYRLVLPDHRLSLAQGVVRAFQGAIYSESQRDLLRGCHRHRVPVDVPWTDLSPEHRAFVIEGEPGYGQPGHVWPEAWYGVRRFFSWLESNVYKMHVRVFLSRYRAYVPCPSCSGYRLQPEALYWKWQGARLPDLFQLPVSDLRARLLAHPHPPGQHQLELASQAILTRLRYLDEVGLGYLTLDRASRTLSGGESQRVNLTACLGTALVDTLFVLDEPSIGLHARDLDRLIGTLRRLTDQGNTVVVVEHDESVIRAADHVVEIGPRPGAGGGRIVFQGSFPELLQAGRIFRPGPAPIAPPPSPPAQPTSATTDRSRRAGGRPRPATRSAEDPPTQAVMATSTPEQASPGPAGSLTGAYLAGTLRVDPPPRPRPVDPHDPAQPWLEMEGIRLHNLRDLAVRVPLQRLVVLSGVSGAGKSTLLDNALYQGLQARSGQAVEEPAEIGRIQLDREFSEIVLVDQSPVSRTPRSNAALFVEAWDDIRELFASTDRARAAGLTASSFSFNSGDGRCPHCEGLGFERIEMQFMADLFVTCPVCEGRRFREPVLEVAWQGRSVAEVLAMTVAEACAFFAGRPALLYRLEDLAAVGLDYLPLGQPLHTLSGGESQRLKLVKYLSRFGSDRPPALLLLDEPTTGLHRDDVARLLRLLHRLVDQGHSLVVIEHQIDVLCHADWILELGPGPGTQGGQLIFAGPPAALAAADTPTAPFLKSLAPDHRGQAVVAKVRGRKGQTVQESRKTPPVPPPRPDAVEVVGARAHNLRNLSLRLPLRSFTVVTGVSGSGKSSLAFDIIFAEGQRRFMESMSSWARQYVEQLPRAEVDHLHGIPPTVAIEQRVTAGTRKSTVATITEVAQYLRLLYARIGIQHSPRTGEPLVTLDPDTLAKRFAEVWRGEGRRASGPARLCAPLVRGRKGHHQPLATWAAAHGYAELRIDGHWVRTAEFAKLDRFKEHDLEAVVATARPREDFSPEALTRALTLGQGACFLARADASVIGWFSTKHTDPATGESFPEPDPKSFSWNSPKGWCPHCRGYGVLCEWMREDEEFPHLRGLPWRDGSTCPECTGDRLHAASRAIRLHLQDGRTISLPHLLRLTPSEVLDCLEGVTGDRRTSAILEQILPEVRERLRFMGEVGLHYLTLDRPTETLSGGEAQRIRLAAQLGSNLAGVLYVLDEPTIGLHARDNRRLLDSLVALRDKGNTLLVVEHDEDTMRRADRVIDLGPGAGRHGGEILANCSLDELLREERSLTGRYLRHGLPHPARGAYRPLPPLVTRRGHRKTPRPEEDWLHLEGACLRNLRQVDLHLPLARLTVVCGVSGAGKSTLLRDLLHPAVRCAIERRTTDLSGAEFQSSPFWTTMETASTPPFARLRGAHRFRAVIEVDQEPIGKTPRSTPATYIGAYDYIRSFFASLPEAHLQGLTAGDFSFNTAGGRCEKCDGAGRRKLEMAFMPDTYVTCEECEGRRYGPRVAEVRWKGRNIAEILAMSFEEAATFFEFHSRLHAILRLMCETGLGYLALGQTSPSLSGGEAQRLKLVSELARGLPTFQERSRGQFQPNLYLLEEPTIGLHLSDCEKLLALLHRLVDQGHTVVVIEHHLDIIAEADYVVEVGPEGGSAGGSLLYQGPLEGLRTCLESPTAPFLRPALVTPTP